MIGSERAEDIVARVAVEARHAFSKYVGESVERFLEHRGGQANGVGEARCLAVSRQADERGKPAR